MRTMVWIAAAALSMTVGWGCAKKPPLRHTEFLSDYSRLEKVDVNRDQYRDPRLSTYTALIVDPVESRVREGALSRKDQAEALTYLRNVAIASLQKAGVMIVDEPGPTVARLQMALTAIAHSTWWKKIHPGSRTLGAGTGGASMEGEVIDSITGEQLAAFVQTGTGNQFSLTNYSTLADVKSAIDQWGEQAARRVQELRRNAP